MRIGKLNLTWWRKRPEPREHLGAFLNGEWKPRPTLVELREHEERLFRQTQGWNKYHVLTVSGRSLDKQDGRRIDLEYTGFLYLEVGTYLFRRVRRSTEVIPFGKVVAINRGLHPRGDYAQVFVELPR